MTGNIIHHSILKALGQPRTQFCVPRWQRRYRWGKSELRQLVRDLVAVADRNDEAATHFGGVLITSAEPSPPGAIEQMLLVDGQQRLTSISLLLHILALRIQAGENGGEWKTERQVRESYIENIHAGVSWAKYRLKLQEEDDQEYTALMDGAPVAGKLNEAFKTLKSCISDYPVETIVRGIHRFTVIAFACKKNDDPQQIFESINATGITLSQSEKVKNWLLMGIRKETQDDVYDNYWRPMLHRVGVEDSNDKAVDDFLGDFLKWKTGKKEPQRYIYTDIKRWWHNTFEEDAPEDRELLANELCDASALYEKIIGRGQHENKKIESLLKTLRGIGIDVHRPLTMRLLHDSASAQMTGAIDEEVILTLEAITTWLVRIWCADRKTGALQGLFALFSHSSGPIMGYYSQYWIEQIRSREFGAVGMPDKPAIIMGLRRNRAFRRVTVGNVARTILWEINSMLSEDTPPPLDELTIEHVMPQTLNDHWMQYLGMGAEEHHERNMNTFANLTLVGGKFNSALSNKEYRHKRILYEKSTVELTRSLGRNYEEWKVSDIERRAEELTDLILRRWPWKSPNISALGHKMRWNLNGDSWRQEEKHRAVLLAVVGALLDKNEEKNSKILMLRGRVSVDIFLAAAPPNTSLEMYPIPGHEEYVISLNRSIKDIYRHCVEFGEMCGEKVNVE